MTKMSKISVIFYCEDAINAKLHAAHSLLLSPNIQFDDFWFYLILIKNLKIAVFSCGFTTRHSNIVCLAVHCTIKFWLRENQAKTIMLIIAVVPGEKP